MSEAIQVVVLHGILDGEGVVSIMLYNAGTGNMRVICIRKNTRNLASRGSESPVAEAHPVSSNDSRGIIFNSCGSDIVRPCEITI